MGLEGEKRFLFTVSIATWGPEAQRVTHAPSEGVSPRPSWVSGRFPAGESRDTLSNSSPAPSVPTLSHLWPFSLTSFMQRCFPHTRAKLTHPKIESHRHCQNQAVSERTPAIKSDTDGEWRALLYVCTSALHLCRGKLVKPPVSDPGSPGLCEASFLLRLLDIV